MAMSRIQSSPLILLVEDDAFLREAFALLLEEAGYRVGQAGSAREALERVAAEPPDLVLLDLGLPDRSGLEVARSLRDLTVTATVPIVALTGRTGPDHEQACFAAGCSHFFTKPLEPSMLLQRLPALLAEASGRPAAGPTRPLD
jgi:CheY-like chemotaxis protein